MYEEIEEKFPEDFARRDQDKYHYRYPRGEVRSPPLQNCSYSLHYPPLSLFSKNWFLDDLHRSYSVTIALKTDFLFHLRCSSKTVSIFPNFLHIAIIIY